MRQHKVKDWMTMDVLSVSENTPLPDAHDIMQKNKVRRLPVVNSQGKLIGIVTRGDIREARPSQATSLSIWEMNYLLSKLQIKQFMTTDIVTVKPDTLLGEVASLMLTKKISGIPVVENSGKLVGIITESDLFRVMVQEWDRE